MCKAGNILSRMGHGTESKQKAAAFSLYDPHTWMHLERHFHWHHDNNQNPIEGGSIHPVLPSHFGREHLQM